MKTRATKPYEDGREHLAAELRHLDLLLGREVERAAQPAAPEGVEEEAATARPARAASTLRAEIERRRRASVEAGAYLPLAHLGHLFGLTHFEEQVVVLCLAAEVERRYERLFAYLEADASRRRPTVELALRLFCPTQEGRLAARRFFGAQAPLFRSRLVRFDDAVEAPLLARTLRLDPRVADFLLGGASLCEEAAGCARTAEPNVALEDLRWPASLKTTLLEAVVGHLRESPAGKVVLHFHGPRGTGRRELAAALCRELGVRLLVVDLCEAARLERPFEETVRPVCREALLLPAAILFENFDRAGGGGDEGSALRRSAARAAAEFSWLTFVSTEEAETDAGLFGEAAFLGVELAAPDARERAGLWPRLAASVGVDVEPGICWDEVAAKFALTPGQMREALAAARNRSRLSGATALTPADLLECCRAASNQKLAALARKLPRRNSWGDITLPPKALAQLREICAQVRHRRTVYGAWGFGEKLARGKGLCALFYGPAGTGKTMAVDIVANELGIDAYRIDLSTVVSKYVGETEKNLSQIFREAETSNAILFFDEADALFGKRTEVKDAHDRYANIEINYLLQRVEEFSGLVVLATNLRKNIDEAFFRRMQFAVDFAAPDETQRYEIWRQHFPASAPVDDDVDFGFLAQRLQLSGGHIRNVVVNAAFLAAERSEAIRMEHLIHAALREYEKIGRSFSESEFAPYGHMLRAAAGAHAPEPTYV
ncbi:MAG: ATP-binding protein [Pyrinomonadaceae bacterium]